MTKVIINMEYRPKYGDLKKAAAALGLRSTAGLEAMLAGRPECIGKAKRDRIVIRYPEKQFAKGV